MKRLIILLLCATLCHAASVTIAESAYADASGRLATGTITISWPSFSNGTSNIAAGSTTATITAGVMSVSLVANDTADPPFNYTASFRLQSSSYSQQWKVPTVAGPLTIQGVTWSSNSPVTIGLDQLRRTGYTAGDIAYYDGTLWKRLPRGTVNGQSLTIDTSLSGYLKWATAAGSGDFSTSTASSVDSEVVLFSGTGGKTGKRATISGLGKFSSGVLSAAVAGTDYESPITAGTTLQYLRGDKSLATFSSAAQSAMSGLYEVPLAFAARLTRSVNSVDLTSGIVTPGSCGDTTHSCGLTVDTYGRVTGATNNAIASSGSGTVTVVGAGALTSTALVTGGGTTTVQTPSATATMDSSGNIITPGAISTGLGGSAGGYIDMGQGTAPSLGTNSVRQYADTAVTAYKYRWPSAAGTGFVLGTNTTNDVVGSFVGFSGTGNVARVTSPTFVTPLLGTPTSGVATNITGLPLTTGVTGILPVANGGTATATPSIVAGTNVTVSGTWPNQTINSSASGSSGLAVAWGYDGGTGITTTPTKLCTVDVPASTLGTGGTSGHSLQMQFAIVNLGGSAVNFTLNYGSSSYTIASGSATTNPLFGSVLLANDLTSTTAQTMILMSQERTLPTPVAGTPSVAYEFIQAINEPNQNSASGTLDFSLKAAAVAGTETIRVFMCSIKLL